MSLNKENLKMMRDKIMSGTKVDLDLELANILIELIDILTGHESSIKSLKARHRKY